MSNSIHYIFLTKKIKQLRKHLLPKNFSKTGFTDAKHADLSKILSFMAHNEIVYYFKELVKDIAIKKVEEWKQANKANSFVIYLLSFYNNKNILNNQFENGEEFSAFVDYDVNELSQKVIDSALMKFIDIVEQNQGFSKKELKCFILPTGFQLIDFDYDFIIDLNEFDRQNKKVFYQNISAQKNIDLKLQYKKILHLLLGLKKFDSTIIKL